MTLKAKQKRRIMKIAAASLCGVSIVAFSAGVTQKTYAEEVWSEVSVSSQYTRGTELSIPSRTVSVGGTSVQASAVLKKPDGSATTKNSVLLDTAGDYTIQYTAKNGTSVYSDTVDFKVVTPIATVSSSASSVVYDTKTADFPTNEKTVHFEKSGLYVRLAQNDTLTIEQTIDVSNITKEDTLVALSVLPDTIGECDFETFNITLTDATDPSVYFRIDWNGYPDEGAKYPYSYARAGGNNQTRRGYEKGKNIVHIENKWGGGGITHSFYGTYTNPYYAEYDNVDTHQTAKLRFDAEELAVYGTTGQLVIDMDDSKYFDEFWGGFTSDKAILSISCADYTKTTANFLISEVYGVDLSKELLDDADTPVISVDVDEDKVPDAKIGTPYEIFSASAFGYYSGKLDVSAHVWYDYNFTDKAVRVSAENGKFIPTKAGYYAIVYTAKAYDGTVGEKVVWVYAGDIDAPQVTTSFSETRVELGTVLDLSEYTTEGGAGETKVTITAKCGNTEIDCTAGTFRPEKAGNWTITYTATDYVGQKGEASVSFEAYAGNKPLFTEDAAVPEVFLDGYSYVLPVLYADDFASGSLNKTKCTVKVYDKNNANGKTIAEGEAYVPSVAENGDTVRVVYTAGTAEKVYEIPTVFAYESGKLKIANYFCGEGFTAEVGTESTTIEATGNSAYFTFANALTAQNLKVSLRTLAASKKYGGIKITLQDAENKNSAIEVSLLNNNGSTIMKTSSGSMTVAAGFSDTDNNNGLTLTYADGYFSIGTVKVAAKKTVSGEDFAGFADKVWLKAELIDAVAGAKFEMLSINTQSFTKGNRDRIAPVITLSGTYGGSYAFGSKVTLPYAVAGDVLDPNTTFTVSVTDPEGNYVVVGGKTLRNVAPEQFEISLNAMGAYRVSYEAEDTSGNTALSIVFLITVVDAEAPEVQFGAAWKPTAKLNEKYVFPTITATDDHGTATVTIAVADPTGKQTVLKSGTDSLKFTAAGRYRITVLVTDESGNCTSYTHYVTVSE